MEVPLWVAVSAVQKKPPRKRKRKKRKRNNFHEGE
jgi:hypothetical protein